MAPRIDTAISNGMQSPASSRTRQLVGRQNGSNAVPARIGPRAFHRYKLSRGATNFRVTPKAKRKFRGPPQDLRQTIALIAQRQDCRGVRLGDALPCPPRRRMLSLSHDYALIVFDDVARAGKHGVGQN